VAGRIRSIEKSSDLIGARTRNLPACSIVPQPTTLPRELHLFIYSSFNDDVGNSGFVAPNDKIISDYEIGNVVEAWPNIMYYATISLEGLKKTTFSGKPVTWPRFEPSFPEHKQRN
jgi:hypothetical protein